METATNKKSFLEFLPVSFYGGVMGLTGLSFAWKLAHKLWNFPEQIALATGAIAILAFLAMSIAYCIKIITFPALVKSEISHPVAVSFFATFIISLLLLPGIIKPYFPNFAYGMWLTAAVMMFFFAIFVIRKWLDKTQLSESAMPAWILPVVGTLDVPIVGSSFDNPGSREICLLFFGIGIVFTFILLPIIIGRLIFQSQLPLSLQPTMLILTGPFALAFSDYQALNGQDMVSTVFFYFNIFLFCILISKIAYVPKACPFRATWWAVSFPLVAITISTFRYYEFHNDTIHLALAAMMLTISTVTIIYLFSQTLYRIIFGTFDS